MNDSQQKLENSEVKKRMGKGRELHLHSHTVVPRPRAHDCQASAPNALAMVTGEAARWLCSQAPGQDGATQAGGEGGGLRQGQAAREASSVWHSFVIGLFGSLVFGIHLTNCLAP